MSVAGKTIFQISFISVQMNDAHLCSYYIAFSECSYFQIYIHSHGTINKHTRLQPPLLFLLYFFFFIVIIIFFIFFFLMDTFWKLFSASCCATQSTSVLTFIKNPKNSNGIIIIKKTSKAEIPWYFNIKLLWHLIFFFHSTFFLSVVLARPCQKIDFLAKTESAFLLYMVKTIAE